MGVGPDWRPGLPSWRAAGGNGNERAPPPRVTPRVSANKKEVAVGVGSPNTTGRQRLAIGRMNLPTAGAPSGTALGRGLDWTGDRRAWRARTDAKGAVRATGLDEAFLSCGSWVLVPRPRQRRRGLILMGTGLRRFDSWRDETAGVRRLDDTRTDQPAVRRRPRRQWTLRGLVFILGLEPYHMAVWGRIVACFFSTVRSKRYKHDAHVVSTRSRYHE